MKTSDYAVKVIEMVYYGHAAKATKYIEENYTVKATLRGKRDHRTRHMEILVTFGPPNFREKEFIKKAVKAKEPFPIRKVQIK